MEAGRHSENPLPSRRRAASARPGRSFFLLQQPLEFVCPVEHDPQARRENLVQAFFGLGDFLYRYQESAIGGDVVAARAGCRASTPSNSATGLSGMNCPFTILYPTDIIF